MNIRNTLRKLKSLRLTREQILCLAAGLVLAVISAAGIRSGSFLQNGSIRRSGYGSASNVYEVIAEDAGGERRRLSVRVSGREYSPEEADRRIAALMEELPALILAGNPSLSEVTADLKFVKSVPGYEGIRIEYYPLDSRLIGFDGKVQSRGLEEPVNTELRVVVQAGELSEQFLLPVTVRPGIPGTEDLWVRLGEEIEEADRSQAREEELRLPETVDGVGIRYRTAADLTPLKLFLLGAVAAVLLGLRPGRDRRKALKERETQMLLDYSDIVSRLIVYTGAGLTIRNSFLLLKEDYEKALAKHTVGERHVFEEIRKLAADLDKGMPESRAYTAFARRTGLKCYVRLCSVLEQNRRNGEQGLKAALELEMQEAFEQRKNTARRLGEEAGTRLTGPLMLSLVTVMIIVVFPAVMKLG